MNFNLNYNLDSELNHKTFISSKEIKINKIEIKKRVPALFLDRDGVIIEDMNYIRDPKKVKILKGACDLIANFKDIGWKIILVSNQSGISRGFFSWNDYEKVNLEMIKLLGNNKPDAIYANGNGPDNFVNSWRKPSPEMLFEATKDLNIILQESIIIGDRLTDLMAGNKAGLKYLIHVLTGHGKKEINKVKEYFGKTSSKYHSEMDIDRLFIDKSQIIFVKNLVELNNQFFLSTLI